MHLQLYFPPAGDTSGTMISVSSWGAGGALFVHVEICSRNITTFIKHASRRESLCGSSLDFISILFLRHFDNLWA